VVPTKGVEILIEKRAEVLDFKNTTAQSTYEALKNGLHPNTRDANGVPLLHLAISKMDAEWVQTLLLAGADPNLSSESSRSFRLGSRYTSSDPHSHIELNHPTPLMSLLLTMQEDEAQAAEKKENVLKIADLLLSFHADVHLSDSQYALTPLHIAAHGNDLPMLSFLIRHGADVNRVAALDSFIGPHKEQGLYTPLLLAVNSINKEASSQCIKLLLDAGADLSLHKNMPPDLVRILNGYAWKFEEEATALLSLVLDESSQHLNYETVTKRLNRFTHEAHPNAETLKAAAQDLLQIACISTSLYSARKYLSHLNSWNGLLGYPDKEELHLTACAGWKVHLQIPQKIKNLLFALHWVENEKISSMTLFQENKEIVCEKIRDEIYNQITAFQTSFDIYLLNHCHLNKNSKAEIVQQKNTGLPIVERIRPLHERISKNWAQNIRSLPPGKAFSIAAGSSNHAIFLEFKRQEDGNFQRTIYNLGMGKEFHSVSADNKYFPSILRDIPKEVFSKPDPALLSYFSDMIFLKNNLWNNKTHHALYSPHSFGGSHPFHVHDLVAMKPQVAGNCSVKNNLAGVKNRLANQRLYGYLKRLEMDTARKEAFIPGPLYKAKELQHDLKTIESFTLRNVDHPQCLEQEMYRFLIKRCPEVRKDRLDIPGLRILDALNAMDPDMKQKFIVSHPYFTKAVGLISDRYPFLPLKQLSHEWDLLYAQSEIALWDLQKDLESPEFLNLAKKAKNIPSLEEGLFLFLCKRCDEETRRKLQDMPIGLRIFETTATMPQKVLDYYIENSPMLLLFCRKVLNQYPDPRMRQFIGGMEQKYAALPRMQKIRTHTEEPFNHSIPHFPKVKMVPRKLPTKNILLPKTLPVSRFVKRTSLLKSNPIKVL
jgi:ankyrin repeat protein